MIKVILECCIANASY